MTVQRQLRKAQSTAMALAGGIVVLACAQGSLPAQSVEDQLAEHQRSAQQAEARQDFTTAVQDYEWIVHNMPQSAEAKSNLAVALYFNKQPERSITVSRRAIAQNPDIYAPHLFLGLALAQLAEPAKAVVELERAIAMNPADTLAHTWLGYELMALGRYDQAAVHLETAASQKPQDPDVWFALGQSYLESGKLATRELVKNYPDGGRTWQLAAEQAEVQENRGRALHLYIEAERRRPDIADLKEKIQALGGAVPEVPQTSPVAGDEDQLYARTRFFEEKARAALARVQQEAPDSYRAHEVVADGYLAAGRYDEAIAEYRLVIALKGDVAGVHASLCDALVRVAKLEDARKECEAEITVSPRDSGAYVGVARVALLQDDYDRARGLLKTALNLGSPPAAAYKFMGEIDFHNKRYLEAITEFNHYLSTEARDASVYIMLARCYRFTGDKGKMDAAIATYKRISDESRESREAQSDLNEDKDDAPPKQDGEGL